MTVNKRLVVSGVTALVFGALQAGYGMFSVPVENAAALGQLNGGTVAYTIGQQMARGDMISGGLTLLFVSLLLLLWVPSVLRALKRAGSVAPLLMVLVGSVALVGCQGPPKLEVFEEIGPNETAFLVPLEGDTKVQGKFMSIEYLNTAKVATKRVTIPTRQHDTGRGPGDFEWVATMKLIKVDRTPVTRVWTKAGDTGTSPSNQAFCVESKESIDFCAGGIAIGTITEDDAAKYQYNYAGKKLADVMDQDVHGYIGTVLSREFGNRNLDQGRKDKAVIFTAALTETRDFFATKGVTLLQFGSSEGLHYLNPKIQDSIDATFVAENDKNTATNEKLAQVERNAKEVGIAIAQRQAAEEFAKAKEANTAIRQLDIEMVKAQAQLELAKNLKDLKGQLPSVVPPGSMFMFGADGLKK